MKVQLTEPKPDVHDSFHEDQRKYLFTFFFGLIPNHALYWVNSSFPWKKLLNTWSYRTSAIIKMRLDKGFVYRD